MRALAAPTGLTALRKEMEQVLDRFWEMELPELPTLGDWTPALDVSETNDSLVVKIEVPGIEPKDIQLNVRNDVLTVRGQRKFEKQERDEHYFRTERAYGSFARSIRMPMPVDSGRAKAEFKHGLLTVTLPKVPAAKGAEIPISTL